MKSICIDQKTFYFSCPKSNVTMEKTAPEGFFFVEEVKPTSFQRFIQKTKSTLRLVSSLFFLAKKIVML